MYWTGRWDLRGQVPHVTEMLGDPCAHIVFERGPSGLSSRLVGVWTRLWQRRLEDRGNIRAVKIRAGALRAVVDAPAVQFANRITPLTELFDGIEALERAVLDPPDDGDGFAAVEAWLRDRPRNPDHAGPMRSATALVEQIVSTPELTTAQQLADDHRRSLRAIQRLFREYVGASPKWVIRRNRLQEVAVRIEKGEVPTLATLAAELGYADQAHLARDFKRVVGRSPSEFSQTVR